MTDATTPLLVEDLLLLLADERGNTIRGEGRLHLILPGAVLAELAMRGAIEIDGRSVAAAGGGPLGDDILDDAVAAMGDRPRDAQVRLVEVGTPLRAAVLARLEDRGVVRWRRGRALGFLPTTRLELADGGRRAELLAAVRAVLADGREPDERTGALAALLFASGTLPQFHPDIPWNGDVADRGHRLQRGDWGAGALGEAMTNLTIAIAAISVAVAVGAGGARAD